MRLTILRQNQRLGRPKSWQLRVELAYGVLLRFRDKTRPGEQSYLNVLEYYTTCGEQNNPVAKKSL